MGVTISYNGRIKSFDVIPELQEEVMDICKAKGWKYTLIDEEPDDEEAIPPFLKGILFGHKDSQPISMLFDDLGFVVSPMLKIIDPKHSEKEWIDREMLFAYTKTQYDGPDFHIEVCNLLKYLGGKYFIELDVNDDSKYYDTGDREHLKKCMSNIDRALSALEDAVEMHSDKIDESTPEELKTFIQEVLAGHDIDIRSIDLSAFYEEE